MGGEEWYYEGSSSWWKNEGVEIDEDRWILTFGLLPEVIVLA